MPDTQALATLVQSRRKHLGLDQYAVATQVGVTQQTVSRWESGSNIPSRPLLKALGEVLQLDRDRLFRLAGYYAEPVHPTRYESSFDAAIGDMPFFTDDQLAEIVDQAWRLLRQRNAAVVGVVHLVS